jgi:polar amino acid transport system ATP-binding protein
MSNCVLEISKLRKSFDTEVVLKIFQLKCQSTPQPFSLAHPALENQRYCAALIYLEPIDDGVIKLDGNDITDVEINPDEVRRKIGMVFQAFNLFPHMSVLENIILAPVRVQI